MLNLDSVLDLDKVQSVQEYTSQRFKDQSKLVAPEVLSLCELGYLSNTELIELSSKAYGHEVSEPHRTYVPEIVVSSFMRSGLVPIAYEPMKQVITAVSVDDYKFQENFSYVGHMIRIVPTTLPYYLREYQRCYGVHPSLNEMPAKSLFMNIVDEAITLGAADITVTSWEKSTRVYYNVRKRRVDSSKVFSAQFIDDLIKLLTIKSPISNTYEPKSLDIDLNSNYRGRVEINRIVDGYMITIRVLPNAAFDTDIKELNLSPKTAAWLKETFLDRTPGLRLMVGATMSGKNTTILSTLREIVKTWQYKVVSVEMPVEQTLPGVEQISVEKESEFKASVLSLIRVNPDFVYITEIRDSIGLAAVQVTNTGKCVFSTLHSNSVADTLSRLVDITGLSQDRVIQSLHSICFQELIRDEEKDELFPRNRYVRFTDDLKRRLYGKTLGEAVIIIQQEEDGD